MMLYCLLNIILHFFQSSVYGVYWAKATVAGPGIARCTYLPFWHLTQQMESLCVNTAFLFALKPQFYCSEFYYSLANICRVYLLISSLPKKSSSKYINLNEILVMFISVFLKTSTLFWECALTILNDNLF